MRPRRTTALFAVVAFALLANGAALERLDSPVDGHVVLAQSWPQWTHAAVDIMLLTYALTHLPLIAVAAVAYAASGFCGELAARAVFPPGAFTVNALLWAVSIASLYWFVAQVRERRVTQLWRRVRPRRRTILVLASVAVMWFALHIAVRHALVREVLDHPYSDPHTWRATTGDPIPPDGSLDAYAEAVVLLSYPLYPIVGPTCGLGFGVVENLVFSRGWAVGTNSTAHVAVNAMAASALITSAFALARRLRDRRAAREA